MDLRDYVNAFYEAEQKNDMNRFLFDGVKLWPLFRCQSITMFRNPGSYFNAGNPPEPKPVSLKEKILNNFYSRKFLKKFRSEIARELSGKACDVLLYSKEGAYTDQFHGKWYNRFLDPYTELLEKKYKVLKLELTKGKAPEKAERFSPTVFINEQSFQSHHFYKYKNTGGLRISGSGSFHEIKKITGLPFEPVKMDSAFREVFCYRDLFREILPLLKPRFIFVKCYYENDAFGLVMAARELGIPTIDIQHGKQGTDHPMYSHYSQVPEGGYEMLPDFFWTWGNESAENILRWRNRKNLHVPLVGGNLWMGKWKAEEMYEPGSKAEADFIHSLKAFRKVISVSLQPLDQGEIIPAELAIAIRNSPADWIWLLRKHPFQKIADADLLGLIGETRAKTEIRFASSFSLFQVLKISDHHLTLWSSTCYEANDFDVPVIIAHPFGKKLYEKQISSGIFTYADTAAEIIRIVEEGKANVKTAYIETDPEIAKHALQTLGLSGI